MLAAGRTLLIPARGAQVQHNVIAPQAGITPNGVGYGVVLNGVAPPKGERLSIDDITRELVKDMEQNEALQPGSDPQPVTVAGIEGRSVDVHSVSPFASARKRSTTKGVRLASYSPAE